MHTIRVWDLPTRLFHWTLVLCVVTLIITGNIGGNAMAWHARAGYGVGSLLLFRLIWGFVGGHWSRFRSFVPMPSTLWAYLRGATTTTPGHNPLGALSVLALLGFLAAQVGTGLLSDDEIAFSGPLTRFVSGNMVSLATTYHKEIGKLILIALVVLHVCAIVFYRFKKGENLVGPMLGGDKLLAEPVPASRDDGRSRVLALVLLTLCVAVLAWVASLGG